eukprot:Rhum_TRINITY_DN4191_c0_g2::Rhum_TRINITY_DN4191_c0_g2_i1::g.13097::m.13097
MAASLPPSTASLTASPAAAPAPSPAIGEADVVLRTVHVLGIDGALKESEFAAFVHRCGVPTRAKICGDPRGKALYGFIEFADRVVWKLPPALSLSLSLSLFFLLLRRS